MSKQDIFVLLSMIFLSLGLTDRLQSQFEYDTSLYSKMTWREIGPFRGGRSIAVTGVVDQQYTYYMGATGGGIWKTEDGGRSWLNVSDGYLKLGVVGALEIAPSDPNVVYAGTGEVCIRGNVMPGGGIYKSADAGRSWKFIGLGEAQTIGKIRVHPKDENLVYAAVFGHVFGPNPERGIYRSKDGGSTWQRVLYKNDKTGGVDIELDPVNPRIIYAALWEAYRNPWSLSSGGPGSGLYKSTDGGDTWVELGDKEGLPKGVKGRIGIAVSGARPGRVWTLVEADDGGIARSLDLRDHFHCRDHALARQVSATLRRHLVLNVHAGHTRLFVIAYRAPHVDRIAVARVGICDHCQARGVHDAAGVIHHFRRSE